MKLMNINSEACEQTNSALQKITSTHHIYASIFVFAIFDTVPCWYEHIQPQKGFTTRISVLVKVQFFRTIHFFTLNWTNRTLQQNFHWLFFCQKLTNELTKKVIYKKSLKTTAKGSWNCSHFFHLVVQKFYRLFVHQIGWLAKYVTKIGQKNLTEFGDSLSFSVRYSPKTSLNLVIRQIWWIFFHFSP